MAYDEALADRVRERLREAPAISERRMFGGLVFLGDGNMMVGVFGDDLIVRVGSAAKAAALARPGAREFDFSRRPMKGIVLAAGESLEDDVLDGWIAQAQAFVATLPSK